MLAGMLDAITDTAQNAQALDVQRAMGRSILNSMHALWSLGSVIGGLMGTAALALQAPLAVHLAISGILFSAVAVFAGTRVLTMEEVARVPPLAESSAQQARRLCLARASGTATRSRGSCSWSEMGPRLHRRR